MSTPTEYECWGTHEMVCPYCGEEQSDSWEYSRDDGTVECGSCSRQFRYTRNVSVDYTTHPIIGPHRLDEFWRQQELEALKDG